MSIDSEILNSAPVERLCEMYAGEYVSPSLARMHDAVPAMLNALGACAGFAAQIAVWRTLVLPAKRNPGEFLVYATTKSNEFLFFGESINQFLLGTGPDRLSFLSLAAGPLSNASELPDIAELAGHVARSMGSEGFGQPRVPPGIDLPELPRAALARTWSRAATILQEHLHAEWPALFGAAAYTIITSNRKFLAPSVAVKILLEAAFPMSKLNPQAVADSGVPAPSLTDWSTRALRPENTQAIIAEVRAALPAVPRTLSARPVVLRQPRIAFLNLAGSACEEIAANDKAALEGLFYGNVEAVTEGVPNCDVLFLYCAFEPTGKIAGHEIALRTLIRDSQATVAVVASQVPGELQLAPDFQKSLSRGTNPPANLVITGNRSGEALTRFFKSLFELMWNRVPMPMAWVTLIPQGPVPSPNDPGIVGMMEAGPVMFGPGRAW